MNNYLPKHFLTLENRFLFDLSYGFGIKTKIQKDYILSGGGPNKEIHKFIDEWGIYTNTVFVNEKFDPSTIHVVVTTQNEQDCATVLIDKNEKIAILHGMSYFEGCAKEGLKKPGGGTKLLRFILKLLLKLSYRYHFYRIILKDNSFLKYDTCSRTVKLASLRMITNGKTWYGKYGFKPYDPTIGKPSDLLKNALDKNNDILSILETKDIYIINIVKNAIKKEKLKNIDLDEIKRLIKQYPLFRNFIIRLTREFDKYCCLLVYIMDTVYSMPGKIRLLDFYEKTFYLDI